ncbi:MAG: hypothetical protein C0445_11070 [Polaromonas sp.]|nr:hypothetical protein [Polaromonas sp.]
MGKDTDFQRWLKNWALLLVPAVCAAAAIVTYAVTFRDLPATENPQAWGTFGDFLGGLLNPLVSTLTLFVAISVWRLQRGELELTRKELEQTKLAMEEQAKTAEQQRQEQRFFDLLNVYQRTVDSISHLTEKTHRDTIETVTTNGKSALAAYLSDYNDGGYGGRKWTEYAEDGRASWWRVHRIEKITMKSQHECVSYWTKDATRFDHYFRVVFRILSEAEGLLGDQHIRYIKLFRAQLSRSELIILAYNLWLDDEGKEMIPLADKYGLLKHLPKGHLRTTLEQELPPRVFGRTRAAELAPTSPAPPTEEAT